jgi:geranylgeranyl diphosphate synthase type I
LLGVFGDPAITGKPVGDDLREGKPTLLASLAWARVEEAARVAEAAESQARFFQARFGATDLTEGEIARLRALIEDSGARRDVEAKIDELADSAERALGSLPVTATAREALRQLAAFATGRDR